MMPAPELGLQEQYVLLAMNVTFGVEHAVLDPTRVDIGVSATVLFQLWRNGRVSLEEGRIRPRGALSVGQTDLDALLQKLGKKDAPFRSRGINSWLLWIAKAKPHKTVLEGLEHKGVLSRKKRKHMLVLPEARKRIIERLRRAIRKDGDADELTAVLVGIADASGVLETGELAGDRSGREPQVEALGRAAAPLVSAVRTAVSQKRLRDSLINLCYIAGGALAALLFAKCSS